MNSMNFKENYKICQEEISPDKEFLDKLEKQMELEQQKQKKTHYSHNIYYRICAAAAVCLIICGAIFIKNGMGQNEVKKDSSSDVVNDIKIGTKSETDPSDKFSFQKGNFSQKDILKNESSKVEKLNEILSEKETKVYKSKNEKFSFDGELTDEEKETLCQNIKSFKDESDEKQSGEAVYYMAVLQNGDAVKFEIFGDKYLKINGYDDIYKKQ